MQHLLICLANVSVLLVSSIAQVHSMMLQFCLSEHFNSPVYNLNIDL